MSISVHTTEHHLPASNNFKTEFLPPTDTEIKLVEYATEYPSFFDEDCESVSSLVHTQPNKDLEVT